MVYLPFVVPWIDLPGALRRVVAPKAVRREGWARREWPVSQSGDTEPGFSQVQLFSALQEAMLRAPPPRCHETHCIARGLRPLGCLTNVANDRRAARGDDQYSLYMRRERVGRGSQGLMARDT
jgi:hypothetical protein